MYSTVVYNSRKRKFIIANVNELEADFSGQKRLEKEIRKLKTARTVYSIQA